MICPFCQSNCTPSSGQEQIVTYRCQDNDHTFFQLAPHIWAIKDLIDKFLVNPTGIEREYNGVYERVIKFNFKHTPEQALLVLQKVKKQKVFL